MSVAGRSARATRGGHDVTAGHVADGCRRLGTVRSRRRSRRSHRTGGGRMGFFTKDIQTMDDLLLHGLQDIYYAEQQITKALPTMIEQATNRDLEKGLRQHLDETQRQIERLQAVFKKL